MRYLKIFLAFIIFILLSTIIYLFVDAVSQGPYNYYPISNNAEDPEEEFILPDDDVGGLYIYGCYYFTGADGYQDRQKGLEWLQKSAEQDFDLAQATLAYLYFKGDGVLQDKEEARRWAEKAEKNGFPIWDYWSQWEQE